MFNNLENFTNLENLESIVTNNNEEIKPLIEQARILTFSKINVKSIEKKYSIKLESS